MLYGEPRPTRDIDITLGFDTEKLATLLSIIKELSLKPIPEEIEAFVKKLWFYRIDEVRLMPLPDTI